jgi:PAS domain S-box-containing protein
MFAVMLLCRAPFPRARMLTPPLTFLTDPARLAALAETGLLDSAPEEVFDRLTRLVVRTLGAGASTLTLLDGERQFFKSAAGPDMPPIRQTPMEHSLCRHTAGAGAAMAVPDTLEDACMRDNPSVTRLGVRAYAGVPLVTSDGHALGTLCALHMSPRAWSADDMATLADLAQIAVAEIERRRAGERPEHGPASLRAADGLIRAMLQQSLAGIFVVQDERFRYLNPRLAEIFATDEASLGERNVWEVVHPDDRASAEEYARNQLYGPPRAAHYSLRGVRADGQVVWLEIHASRAEVEGRAAAVGLVVDVSERVTAERERQEAVAARDRFYAMASHELRTPVSAVMLYNELLLGEGYGTLGPEQRDAVERSQRCAADLLELINDLLDLSRLESGKVEPRIEEVELVALARDAVAAVEVIAAEQSCTVTLEAPEPPLVVGGDGKRIRQILLNLLGNAVKYGHGRPVRVLVARHGSGAIVEVADLGPGIPAADQARIFEDFVRLDDAADQGTGLGLPIARRLAQLLGGSLEVASVVGQGSTFRLTLPA